MNETITQILQANAEDGKVRRRDVASLALLLLAPVAIVAGIIAGPGVIQQSMALGVALALVVSMRLVVKPAGGARVVYVIGAAAAALTLVGGATPLNGGVLALEPACAALLVTAAALFAARLNGHRPAAAAATEPSAG